MKNKHNANQLNSHNNTIRIIGGYLRGTKIKFPSETGLRPTSDRTKETLFNWLTPYIHNSHCLDLFTGSGSLGFEALSRGAKTVTMVDQSKTVYQQLTYYQTKLAAIKPESTVNIIQSSAESFITTDLMKYDIVFLDPPFNQDLLLPCLNKICKKIAMQTLIYFEAEKSLSLDECIQDNGLLTTHHKTTRDVQYGLLSKAN